MALKIGDQVTTDPQREDIARAVDTGVHNAAWRLGLDNGQDDHIEVTAASRDTYKVKLSIADNASIPHQSMPIRSRPFSINISTATRTGETRPGSVSVSSMRDRMQAAKRISSKPPAWAIVLIAGSFIGLPVLFYILPRSVFEGYGILPIVLVVGGPMSVMLVVIIVNKLLQLRSAGHWPQAAGRIVKSDVMASHQQRIDEATEVVNLPAIEYEFSANGRNYIGRRISVGEDSGGANIEATLARYPVGAAVAVYYDPANPENCVLERGIPSFQMQGCGTTLTSLAFIGAGVFWFYTNFDSVVAPLWATSSGRIVIIASVWGCFV